MSRTTTAARRIALLSTSSFGLAAIASAASLGVALAPTTALAADECGVQSGSTPIVCSGATYFPGVTYDANGNLVVTFTASVTEAGVDGIRLTGDGSESITFDSATTNTELESRDTVGPLLDVTTVSGDINIQTEEMDADGQNPAGVTHAIRATSGSGNINITTTNNVDADSSANPANSIGIEAVTAGAIDITTGGNASGRLRGIFTDTTGGDGATMININAGTSSIEARTGTGLLTINFTGGGGSAVTSTGANAAINIATGRLASSLNMTPAAGTTTTVTNDGEIGPTNTNSIGNLATVAVQGAGAGRIVIDNHRWVGGQLDFSAMAATGGVTFTTSYVSGEPRENGWNTTGTSRFSPGDDVLGTSSGGVILIDQGRKPVGLNITRFEFGGGDDEFRNEGILALGAGRLGCSGSGTCLPQPSTITLTDLESFNNSGTIMLGTLVISGALAALTPDGITDDVLVMNSGTFTGSGAGRIVMDVNLAGGASQASCDRDTTTNLLAAADCVDFRGATTAGVTGLSIQPLIPGDRGSTIPDEGILLVDVEGGTSHAGDFIIDPTSSRYDPTLGVVNDGVILYTVVYDAGDQQHILVSLPSGAQQLGEIVGAVQDVWRTSAGTFFDRQADLRSLSGGLGEEAGVWVRATADFTERDLVDPYSAFDSTIAVDNSYSQDTWAASVGLDLIRAGGDDDGFVLGIMAGYAHSELTYDASPNTARFDGMSGGVYASYIAGPLFVNAAFNANGLTMDNYLPALGLNPSSSLLTSDVRSNGAQVEAGWRLPIGDSLFVEPLASVAYVKTDFDDAFARSDDVSRPGTTVAFDAATSLRGALGARLGMDADYGPVSLQYSLSARISEEFEGGNGLVVKTGGPDMAVLDDFAGQFSELGAGVSLYSDNGALSGFLNARGRFGDDYQSIGGTVGFRYRW